MTRVALCCFCLITLISPLLAEAKPSPVWKKHGIVINDTQGNTPQHNPKMISDGYGNYIVAWEDGRSGYYDIYVQKLNGAGQLLWAKNGVAACNSFGNQNFFQLVSDGAGGAILAWQDYRNNNSDIYAQRVNHAGQKLWSASGVPVCQAEAGQFAPELVTDSNNNVIITWHDYRSGSGEDIFAQKLDNTGTPVWQRDGAPVSLAKGTQWYPKIASDGAGGAIITWADGRLSSSDNNIFAQRLNTSGQAVWQKDGVPICAAPHNQEKPEILATTNGAIIAWNDSRYNSIDIFSQKIDLSGNSLWTKDGLAATDYAYDQEDPRLASDGSDGVVLVWTDRRMEKSDIYAQRINSNGSIAWSEDGRPICKDLAVQENPKIINLSNNDYVIFWDDKQPGKGKTDLYAQKLNNAGTPLWDQRGIIVASGRDIQGNAAAAATPDGNAIVAWEDSRYGNPDIYAQKIESSGTFLWQNNGLIVCACPGSVVQQNVDLIHNGKGEIIAVFEDARSGYFNIYAQKISKSGNLLWGRDGLVIAKVAAHQSNPKIASDGKGGVLIAWEDYRIEELPTIRAQHISRAGKRLWESSQPVCLIRSRQTKPLLVSDKAGGAIIAWQDNRDALSLEDIYTQRISAQGKLLWGKKGKIFISANGEQVSADMISDGAKGAFLTWVDYRRGDRNPDIYAQRIDPKGKVLWQDDGVLVCGAPDVQRAPKLYPDGIGGIVIAWTDKGGGSYDIYAQRLNKSGKTLWMTDGIPINQLSRTQQNALFGNKKLLVWEDYRYGNWDIFATAVSDKGKLLWGEEGVQIAVMPHTQYAPQVAPWKNGSVLVGWEDYRSGQYYEIYMQKLNLNGKLAWPINGIKNLSQDGGRAPKLVPTPSNDSFYLFWEDYTNGGRAIFAQRYVLY